MNNALPLDGIRVVDLSHSWAAPHCGRLLADFGAEVIKVEYVRRLCLLRGAKKEGQAYNTHPGWLQVNRNKRSITLDLKNESDRQILKDLVRISDIVLENSRTGVLDKLGVGYQELKQVKNDLIMISMTAFGNTGPYASFAGYGAIMESVGGIQSLTAYDKGAKPSRVKELDVTNGIAGASAVMTALLHRQRTGEGQYIDLSQMETATHGLIGEHLLEYAMKGTQTLPLGNRHRKHAPQGCYRCAGEDKWVTVTVRSDGEWQSLCEIMQRPEWLSDDRFATTKSRIENHDILDSLIEEWTKDRTNHEVMHLLQSCGIPAGAVLDVSELAGDMHLQKRNYFMKEESGSGRMFMGMPFRLSKADARVVSHGPELGRDNEYVFCTLLGRPHSELKPVDESSIATAFDAE